MKNHNLTLARRNKNDELYTPIDVVEHEILLYKKFFAGKSVYCNCDNPEQSAFYAYCKTNFRKLKLVKLTASALAVNETPTCGNGGMIAFATSFDGRKEKKFILKTGDFRSEECEQLLIDHDIIVTNPPFSIFEQHIHLILKHNKSFLIIGNLNACGYKYTLNLIANNIIRISQQTPARTRIDFINQHGERFCMSNTRWFTNLGEARTLNAMPVNPHKPVWEELPEFDYLYARNADRMKDVPDSFPGILGVPITMVDYCHPDRWKIIGQVKTNQYPKHLEKTDVIPPKYEHNVNGIRKYTRILIEDVACPF